MVAKPKLYRNPSFSAHEAFRKKCALSESALIAITYT